MSERLDEAVEYSIANYGEGSSVTRDEYLMAQEIIRLRKSDARLSKALESQPHEWPCEWASGGAEDCATAGCPMTTMVAEYYRLAKIERAANNLVTHKRVEGGDLTYVSRKDFLALQSAFGSPSLPETDNGR